MKRALLLTTALCVLALPAAAETLPLKRVAISTSGLALYEHQGTVNGTSNIQVPVRLDAVDDILKSLVVMDSAGEFGGVSLPGREPLSQSFRDLPFSREDLNSPVSLMNALQGAEVEITGANTIKGRLMNVVEEITTLQDGETITRHRVSVITPEGMKTAVLENLNNVRFTEKSVQDQIDRALQAVYTNRIRDQRELTVTLKGAESRPVGITYVQAAPLWKSAYRLVMPEGSDKAFLQGWAILENTTGIDWDNVDVTILSGAPVTYRQSLYESYYLTRPELPVKIMDRVLPRVDGGTLGSVDDVEVYAEEEMMHDKRAAAAMPRKAIAANMVAEAAVSMDSPGMDASMAYGGAAPMPAAAPMEMAQATMAIAQDAATQMVFTFPEPVTLAAGNSLMVPFISREIPAERVWLYQPETNQGHPLAAVEIDNSGETGLPPGILTLYEQTGVQEATLHVGDAEMPMVPKSESRFISYALDTKTKIDQQTQDDRKLGLLTISKGMLNQKVLWRNTTKYAIKAPAEEERIIVIEHPRRPDWELVKPEGLAEEPEVTDTHYRVKVTVPKGETKTVSLTLQRDDIEMIGLTGIQIYDLDTRIAALGKDVKPEIRKALEKIRTLQTAVYNTQAELNQLAQQRQQIFNDQERLRENLDTVATNNELGKRYLKELNTQEDTLAQMKKNEATLQQNLRVAQKELSDYVSGLEL